MEEENHNQNNEPSNQSEESQHTETKTQEPKPSIQTEEHLGKRAKTEIKKLSSNKIFWIALGIIGIALIIMFLRADGETVSADFAANAVLEFANAQGANAELEGVEEENGFYKVSLSIQGQTLPVYVTKDGKYFTSSLIPLETPTPSDTPTQTPPPTEVTKSDKPNVELFIMSHCPYGTQIEKGIIPVAELLGDKIDFEIKFVDYAMHPTQGEVEEQLNQYCIQKEQNAKYLDYLTCFLGEGKSEECLTSTGIDKTKLSACYAATDTEFDVIKNLEDKASWNNGRFPQFNIHKEENTKYGVQGSPTLVINGAQAQAGRDAASLLTAICSAFNTEPSECSETLSSDSPSPGFGFSASTGATNDAAQCG
ncbi:hypothetical protein HOE04_04275 [archaeon]|jgi:hypothetical protein|nr:hypothetical protein [archaeon]